MKFLLNRAIFDLTSSFHLVKDFNSRKRFYSPQRYPMISTRKKLLNTQLVWSPFLIICIRERLLCLQKATKRPTGMVSASNSLYQGKATKRPTGMVSASNGLYQGMVCFRENILNVVLVSSPFLMLSLREKLLNPATGKWSPYLIVHLTTKLLN